MQRLTEREVRFLCWKIKQGRLVPQHKLTALLDELALRGESVRIRSCANDNAPPFGPGCRARFFLFKRYEHCVSQWMRKVLALGDEAGRKSNAYKALWNEVTVARAWVTKARSDYERHLAEHGCGHIDEDL